MKNCRRVQELDITGFISKRVVLPFKHGVRPRGQDEREGTLIDKGVNHVLKSLKIYSLVKRV